MPLQILASRVLAAALFECLPGLVIQDVGISMGGIYCDFSFTETFSTEILAQLEERIRQIVRDNRAVKVMEMVPFSASEFLKKKGQPNRARQVMAEEDYVRLVEIGSFVDWCQEPCLLYTKEVGFIRLVNMENRGKKSFRIFGLAAPSKDDLNSRIKAYKRMNEWDHDIRGRKEDYWEVIDNQMVWLSRGLNVRRQLCDHWRKLFLPIALEVEGDESKYQLISNNRHSIPVMFFRNCDEPSIKMRRLLDARRQLVLDVKSFNEPLKNCISFLQTVDKSLSILGLTYRIRLWGKKRKAGVIEIAIETLGWKTDEWVDSDQPKLEFLISDNLNCEWVIAAVREHRKKSCVDLTVWVERNLALLLEKNEALLPFLTNT